MAIKIGVIMDPLESINIKKDSTYAMIKEASNRDWQIFTATPHDLYVKDGIPKGILSNLIFTGQTNNWYEIKQTVNTELTNLDIILIRTEPPFDMEYIYTTYLLELISNNPNSNTLIANDPSAIRSNNEKLSTLQFPEITPTHIVTASKQRLLEFIGEQKTIIVKPLDGMGGQSIFKITEGEDNTSVILDTITNYGTQTILAQKFIPEIKNGDKRILLIDGKPVEYGLARVPAKGEFRGNLAAGATGVGFELSKRDKFICDRLGERLKEQGLLFVGIDVIGDYLTEINVTCPTCIQELDNIYNINIAGLYLDCLESKL